MELSALFCSDRRSTHGKAWDAFKGLSVQVPGLAWHRFLVQSQTGYKDFLGLAACMVLTHGGLVSPRSSLATSEDTFGLSEFVGRCSGHLVMRGQGVAAHPARHRWPHNKGEPRRTTEQALGLREQPVSRTVPVCQELM